MHYLSPKKEKIKGKCLGCKKEFSAGAARKHLLACKSTWRSICSRGDLEEGYLVKVSWTENPQLYWMFLSVPISLTFDDLDYFLRDKWLECCGHLSCFQFGLNTIFSRTESGYPSQAMNREVQKEFYPGLDIDYHYDMGSTTELTINVLVTIESCPKTEPKVLMQNNPPEHSCIHCDKKANAICVFCQETMCQKCSKKTRCPVEDMEEEGHETIPIVNSPRMGVCCYTGEDSPCQ